MVDPISTTELIIISFDIKQRFFLLVLESSSFEIDEIDFVVDSIVFVLQISTSMNYSTSSLQMSYLFAILSFIDWLFDSSNPILTDTFFFSSEKWERKRRFFFVVACDQSLELQNQG